MKLPFSSLFRKKKGRKSSQSNRARAFKKSDKKASRKSSHLRIYLTILMYVLLWVAASFTVVGRQRQLKLDYVLNQTVDRYIEAEVPIEWEDESETTRRKQVAASRTSPIFKKLNHELINHHHDELFDLFLSKIVPDENNVFSPGVLQENEIYEFNNAFMRLTPVEAKDLSLFLDNKNVAKRCKTIISDSSHLNIASNIDMEVIENLPFDINNVNLIDDEGSYSRTEIVPVKNVVNKENASQVILEKLLKTFPQVNKQVESALAKVLPSLISVNISYDVLATDKAKQEAQALVQPVIRVLQKGKIILRPGQKVTAKDIRILKIHHANLQNNTTKEDIAVEISICLVITCLLAYILFILKPDVFSQTSHVVLAPLIVIIQLVINWLAAYFYFSHYSASFLQMAVLPLALGATLVSPLLGVRVALWTGLSSGIFVAIQNGYNLKLFIIATTSSMVAAMFMRKARKRYHAFRAALAIAAAITLLATIFMFQEQIPPEIFTTLLVIAVANGIITSTVASTVMPFFEWSFGLITEISLLELNDLNHPLLKRLQIEAPGTYHHSLMVATLAEQAAEAIGADPLLTRVCAYFHDIGKLSHPEYFTENSMGRDLHKELQPRMSSLVILNHVKEGIELAYKYRLKRCLREAIAQHHGTSLVYFFYRRAMDQNNDEKRNNGVGESDYRYPGPRPQRKEIVLLSLADCCEAAARSMDKPTHQKINALVDDIFFKKIRDNQLDKAELTFNELAIAKNTISHALGMMLHGRVKYPEELETNENNFFKTATQTCASPAETLIDYNKNGNSVNRSA